MLDINCPFLTYPVNAVDRLVLDRRVPPAVHLNMHGSAQHGVQSNNKLTMKTWFAFVNFASLSVVDLRDSRDRYSRLTLRLLLSG